MTVKLISMLILVTIAVSESNARECNYYCDCSECYDTVSRHQCLNDDDYCYTIDDNFVSKGCINRELGKTLCENHQDGVCYVCEEDYCNHGQLDQISIALLLSTVLFFFV